MRDLFAKRSEPIREVADSKSAYDWAMRQPLRCEADVAIIDEAVREPNFERLVRVFREHPKTRHMRIIGTSVHDQAAIDLATEGMGLSAAISKTTGLTSVVDLTLRFLRKIQESREVSCTIFRHAMNRLLRPEDPEPGFDTFVIYAREDLERAARFHVSLSDAKISSAMDIATFPYGDEWWEQAKAQIRLSSTVTLLGSRISCESLQVRRELDYALMLNKRILPVALDNVDRAAFGPTLAKLNWLDLSEL